MPLSYVSQNRDFWVTCLWDITYYQICMKILCWNYVDHVSTRKKISDSAFSVWFLPQKYASIAFLILNNPENASMPVISNCAGSSKGLVTHFIFIDLHLSMNLTNVFFYVNTYHMVHMLGSGACFPKMHIG